MDCHRLEVVEVHFQLVDAVELLADSEIVRSVDVVCCGFGQFALARGFHRLRSIANSGNVHLCRVELGSHSLEQPNQKIDDLDLVQNGRLAFQNDHRDKTDLESPVASVEGGRCTEHADYWERIGRVHH